MERAEQTEPGPEGLLPIVAGAALVFAVGLWTISTLGAPRSSC